MNIAGESGWLGRDGHSRTNVASPSVYSTWSGRRALLLCEAGLGVALDGSLDDVVADSNTGASTGPSASAIEE